MAPTAPALLALLLDIPVGARLLHRRESPPPLCWLREALCVVYVNDCDSGLDTDRAVRDLHPRVRREVLMSGLDDLIDDVLTEREGVTAASAEDSPSGGVRRVAASSRSVNTKRKAKEILRGDGKCTAYAPARTKCKICGKVHPL